MSRVLVVVAVVGAFMLGGCGSDDSKLASCDVVYVAGKVVTADQVKDGCLQKDGSTLRATTCEQVSGALLVTYEKSDPPLWGIVGKPLHAASGSTLGDDPDYVKAAGLC